MGEKEKAKRSPSMGFLRSCLILSLYPVLILTIFGIAFLYWLFGGYVKPSLDPQYIPTAEYLLKYPIVYGAAQKLITFETNIVPDCDLGFTITTFPDDRLNLNWAELYINEQLVARTHVGFIASVGYSSAYCYEGHLDSGLHIIEIRVKKHLFIEPYYIQRWAIEIP